MELLASTRVICAITSEYFRGLSAVGFSGHMITTHQGPLSGLTSHAVSTVPPTNLSGSKLCAVHLGISSGLRDSAACQWPRTPIPR